MHDLKDITCDVHYENYRAQCIQQMTRLVTMVFPNILLNKKYSAIEFTYEMFCFHQQTDPG